MSISSAIAWTFFSQHVCLCEAAPGKYGDISGTLNPLRPICLICAASLRGNGLVRSQLDVFYLHTSPFSRVSPCCSPACLCHTHRGPHTCLFHSDYCIPLRFTFTQQQIMYLFGRFFFLFFCTRWATAFGLAKTARSCLPTDCLARHIWVL